MPLKTELPTEKLEEFCRRWKITRLEAFGSVLRDDFGPESDVDLLVTFAPEARTTLIDLASMKFELEDMLGREVDLLSRRGVEQSQNDIRREGILSDTETVYAA